MEKNLPNTQTLMITWMDGHSENYSFQNLRENELEQPHLINEMLDSGHLSGGDENDKLTIIPMDNIRKIEISHLSKIKAKPRTLIHVNHL